MKTKLDFKKSGVVMLLLSGTFIFSCKDAEVLNIPESDLTLKSAGMENVVC